jgi:hypothetical protein
MSRIVSFVESDAGTGPTYTSRNAPHQTGDLLYHELTQDVGATEIQPDDTSAAAGWQMLAQIRSGTVVRHAVAWKFAASSNDPDPVFDGASDDWLGACKAIRGAHPTAPFGSVVSGTDYLTTAYGAASSYTSGAITTGAAGCLILDSFGVDTGGIVYHAKARLSDARGGTKQTTIAIAQISAYRQQESAGAVAQFDLCGSLSRWAAGITVAVRNADGEGLQPDLRGTINEMYWYGDVGALHDPAVIWDAPSAFATAVGGINCSAAAPTPSTSGNVDEPSAAWGRWTALVHAIAGSAGESTPGVGTWQGGSHAFAAPQDLSSAIISLNFYRTSNVGSDNVAGDEGMLIGLSDGVNWAAYQIQNTANGWIRSTPCAAHISVANATPYASSSGALNTASVARIAYLWHRTGAAAVSFNIGVKNFTVYTTPVALTGGGVGRPATFADYAAALCSWGNYQAAVALHPSQVLAKTTLQIGDGGVNTTYFDGEAQSLAFPQVYSRDASGQLTWNAGELAVQLRIKAGDDDTVNLAAGVFTSSNNQSFVMDPATSLLANHLFAGESAVGASVYLIPGISYAGLMAKSGTINLAGVGTYSFNIGSAQTVNLSPAGVGTYALGACDITGTVDLRNTTAHAVTVELPAGATYTTANNAGGTITVQVASLTLTIEANVSLAGAEIRIYDLDAAGNDLGTELAGVESCGTATYSYSGSAGNSLWIQIMLSGYEEFGQALTMPSSSATFTAILQAETNA